MNLSLSLFYSMSRSIKQTRFWAFGLFCVFTLHASLGAPRDCTFEDLGEPLRVRALGLEFVTREPDGGFIAWGYYHSHAKAALVGVSLSTGDITTVDLTAFGLAHIQSTQAADGSIYLYAGSPGHFLKYDPVQHRLLDLGVPVRPASYSIGSTVGPDGKFYVGTFPQACLARCDPLTGKVESLGRLSPDRRECYLLSPAAASNNVIYCPVGLHHRELWAVDASTGAKKQILPDSLTGSQGIPVVWRAPDGEVYGRAGRTSFRCRPDGIEIGKTERPEHRSPLRAGDQIVSGLDGSGELVLKDAKTSKVTRVPTLFEGNPRAIFSVSCEREGKVYGGTMFPATSFYYDTRTRQLTDLGLLTSSDIQVYDTLNHPEGLFLSSYMPASVDFYDPAQERQRSVNPRHIVTVSGQERPVQLAAGPDGLIYTGTFPAKGRLGGALVRMNPTNGSHQAWVNVISNQSIVSLTAIPETGELLCTTSVEGGSSAIPSEKTAWVFLWDCRRQKVAFQTQPIPGAKSYGAVVRARNGIVYGEAGGHYYAFDPKVRKTLFTGVLPVKSVHFPGLSDEPAGPRGLIYGLGEDVVFAIDPADHSATVVARDQSLKHAHGFYVTADAVLYYGSGSRLMRCRLGE
jgi:outer membrane protein assembly factor BamB